MRDVAIIGVGMIKFGKYYNSTLPELGEQAVVEALKDSGVKPKEIEAVYNGCAMTTFLPGQRHVKRIGISGIPILNIENMCSSSGVALREAWIAISSGLYDIALVIGAEKLTDTQRGGPLPVDKDDIESNQGSIMPAIYAMRARRHMVEYGLTPEHMAMVTVKSRKNAALNPYTYFQKEVTVEDVLSDPMIADPLTRSMCCPVTDGAAALVVCSMEKAKRYTNKPIKILASELSSGVFKSGFLDMTLPEITVRGAKMAYEMAGCGPEDIDVAECHDAFSIAELIYYEALGFCGKGESAKFISEGLSSIGGKVAVNPSGGLMSRGHPVGASGAAQLVEIVLQLRGQAGARQVKNAKLGLTHVTGGGIAGMDHGACCIHILER